MTHTPKFAGEFHAECRNPDGSLAWRERLPNGVTTAGLTDLLAVGFVGGTQRSWRIGLIGASGFTAVAAADTMASHAGWTEATSYNPSTRPAWSAISGVALATGPSGVFTFTSAITLAGMFLASDSTKGGTAGVLWSTALFPSNRVVTSGQTLAVTYTLRAAGGGS